MHKVIGSEVEDGVTATGTKGKHIVEPFEMKVTFAEEANDAKTTQAKLHINENNTEAVLDTPPVNGTVRWSRFDRCQHPSMSM